MLLEDIDVVGSDRSLTAHASTDQVSLSGLLNVIDGICAQQGRLIIMSTNRPEALDSALLRPGRVDKKFGFMLANSDMAENLFLHIHKPTRNSKSDCIRGK